MDPFLSGLASFPLFLPGLIPPGFENIFGTHRGPVDLRKWAIFNTIPMSPKSWLSQEELDAGCEHSLVPMDS